MRKIGLVTAAAAAVVALLVGCEGADTAASEGGTSSAKDDGGKAAEAPKANRPEDDVKLDKCGTDDFGKFPRAELTVVNHSSKTSNYMIQVEFTDGAGTRVSEGVAALNNLAPDQTAKEKAVGLTDAPSDLKCKITEVTRYASR